MIWWLIAIPLGLVALIVGGYLLFFFWPLILCWHFGHPIIGVFAEVFWIAMITGR